MTTISRITGDVTVIWPEIDLDDQFEYEHAIVVARFRRGQSITISQCGHDINVPAYALDALLAELRRARKDLASAENRDTPT